MRRILTVTGFAVALVAMAVARDLQKPATAEPTTKPQAAGAVASDAATAPSIAEDEKPIRLSAEAFVKAYNAGDAKAIAKFFVASGEIVSEEGQATHGHEAIEKFFADIFKEHPKTHMKVAVGSIRFIIPDMAIEEGVTTVTQSPDDPALLTPYSVVHVRQDGNWLTASARDLPSGSAAADEQLQQLRWMIGDWVDESPDALVLTSYRWTDNQCYILGEFKVQVAGRPVMTGTQRIGWDPLAKKIRSWVFDSEGGYCEGVWTREGNQWIVKMTGVTRDGKSASSTNITTRISKDRMTWQQRDRIVGMEKTPDTGTIPITRKPPPPM